jgi:hypothetical protein
MDTRMRLEIILRIHDGQNIHGNKPRYIDIPKKDLILGCLSSLINSANVVTNAEISLIILNDHCTKDCIFKVHQILQYFNHSYELIDLEVPGFHYSGLKQFEYCKNSTADFVYSVEDDYLHCTEAIQEMLSSYEFLKHFYSLDKELCLFPFDNPEDYECCRVVPEKLFRTPSRHWKTGIWTTFTMMTSPKVFQDYWELFEKLATQYTPWNGVDEIKELVHEGNTISDIWEHHAIRVNPIPSLALHIQFERQRDPHINHLEWWNKYSGIHKFGVKYD